MTYLTTLPKIWLSRTIASLLIILTFCLSFLYVGNTQLATHEQPSSSPSFSSSQKLHPHIQPIIPSDDETEIYATFLSVSPPSLNKTAAAAADPVTNFLSSNDDVEDWYYKATRILVYKLLRDPTTAGKRKVLVLTTTAVPDHKKRRLELDGATVLAVDPIRSDNVQGRQERWVDQFTKLHLWTLTQYRKIVYIDADVLLYKSPSPLFTLFPTNTSHPTEPYTFGAVPLSNRTDFNAGLFVMSPSVPLFDYMMELMEHPEIGWHRGKDMEQGLLNWIFKEGGDRPYTVLPWQYNAKEASEGNIRREGIIGAHARYWMSDFKRWKAGPINLWYRTLGFVEGSLGPS